MYERIHVCMYVQTRHTGVTCTSGVVPLYVDVHVCMYVCICMQRYLNIYEYMHETHRRNLRLRGSPCTYGCICVYIDVIYVCMYVCIGM